MSNFATVSRTRNQRLQMWARIDAIGPTQSNQKGTLNAKCKLTDDQGMSHNVTLYTDIPPISLLNTRHIFSLSSFDGNYNGKPYVGYSGFWQHNAGGQQQAPQQNYQQAPPRQAPPPQGDLGNSIERQCAWKSACTVAASSSREFTLEETLRWAVAGLKFIETGEMGPLVVQSDWVESLPQGAPREPGEDPDEGTPQDPQY